MHHFTGLLKFSEKLFTLILRVQQPEDSQISSLVAPAQACLINSQLSGIFGLIIDSALQLGSNFLSAAIRGWHYDNDRVQSSLENCIRIIRSNKSNDVADKRPIFACADWQVRLAVAFELTRRQRFEEAYPQLSIIVLELKPVNQGLLWYREYAVTMIECLKCCNYLGNASEGERHALRALDHRSLESLIPTIYSNLRITLADSLISQNKYSTAKAIIEGIQSGDNLSSSHETIVSLRLSKINRRMGNFDASEFSTSNILRDLNTRQDIGVDVRRECLDELSSLLFFQERRQTGQDKTLSSMGKAIIVAISGLNPDRDWRTSHLRDQIARRSISPLALRIFPAPSTFHRNDQAKEPGNQTLGRFQVIVFYDVADGTSLDLESDLELLQHDYHFGNLEAPFKSHRLTFCRIRLESIAFQYL